MSGYKDCHKYFLQSIMQDGVVSKMRCHALFEKSCQAANEPTSQWDVASFVSCINKQIQPFHLEIRKGYTEDDGNEIYALISITDHEINHLAIGGSFTKAEIEIFRRTLVLIVSSTTGMVSSTEILNLTDDLQHRNVSKSDTEALIAKLVKQKWLGEKDGIVYLEPRSFLELEPYIKSDLKDYIVYCGICRSMVFRGIICQKCRRKIHNYCAATYFRGRSESDCKCPSCYEVMPTSSLSNVSFDDVSNGLNGEAPASSAYMERRKRRR